jgi:exodeoxyribonuclease-5
MNLTSQQSQAFEMIKRIAGSSKTQIGVVRGYAGTGKTTLLGEVARELGDICVVTPTGKAALRVREATGVKARTIHMWMYAPDEDEKGRVVFRRKQLEKIYRPRSGLMVIDEASMVDEDLWDEFYGVCKSLNLNIVAIGDSFQLPPVNLGEDGPFSLLSKDFPFHESVELTEVMRQALDSPIIRASMEIRENKIDEALAKIPFTVPSKLLANGLRVVEGGGALISWTNAQRHKLNGRVREAKNLPLDGLAEGEPLLVLKNDYDLNVYNGEVVKFERWSDPAPRIVSVSDRTKKSDFKITVGRAKIHSDNIALNPEYLNAEGEIRSREYAGLCIEEIFGKTDSMYGAPWDKKPEEEEASPGMSQKGIASGSSGHGIRAPHLHANFGYTLTCHKAQGSEWNEVIVVVEPRMNLYNLDSRRWMYTAVTRAKERLSICYLPD